MKSKGTAAVLAFFLGGLGGHKFYLDQTGKGLLYLVFSWTFIPAFIALFEFVALLLMGEEEFNRKYNKKQMAGQGQQQIGQNVTVNVPGESAGGGGKSTAEELEKLENLREKGAISNEEFEQQKRRLLSD